MSTRDLTKLSDKALKELLDGVYIESRRRENIKARKTIKKKIEKMGMKIRVVFWENDTEGYDLSRYSFYLVNGDEELCIYYDVKAQTRQSIRNMIPSNFREESENAYSFRGTYNEAVSTLNEVGVTDVVRRKDV